jgi:hypothetical protein
MSTPSTALGASLLFIIVFGFGRTQQVANYNFVAPYSHEMTHGLVLAIGALYLLAGASRRWLRPKVMAAGALTGLLFLTKAEMFVAGALASATVLGLLLAPPRVGLERRTVIDLFLGGMTLPIAAAFVLLCMRMPPPTAGLGLLGSWRVVLEPAARSLIFFKTLAGTADPMDSLWKVALAAGAYLAVFGALGLAAFRIAKDRVRWMEKVAVLAVAAGIAISSRFTPIAWAAVVRPLTVLLLIGLILACVLLRQRGWRHTEWSERRLLQAGWLVLSLALLPKIALNVQTGRYGFVLAAPGTLLLVVALVDWIPEWIDRHGGAANVFRKPAAALCLAAVAGHVKLATMSMQEQQFRVGRGVESFRSDSRGRAVDLMVGELKARVKPGETLAVLPEGAMLNYLSRTPSSIPYINLMPPEMFTYGEDQVLAALERTPPDYVIFAHKDTSEFGYQFFGRDYGRNVYAWVLERYDRVLILGAEPFTAPGEFGMTLLRLRKSARRG